LLRHSSVLCAYWPRRIEARDGQHSGVVTTALVKLTPLSTHGESSAERSKTDLSRSSARTTITLGLSPAGTPSSSVFSPCPPQEEHITAAAARTAAGKMRLNVILPIRKVNHKDMPSAAGLQARATTSTGRLATLDGISRS
jgi:hypothetical protein